MVFLIKNITTDYIVVYGFVFNPNYRMIRKNDFYTNKLQHCWVLK